MAWQTLQNSRKRAEYLLSLHGFDCSGGSDTLPAIRALEDEALSAEVEDSATIARVSSTNNTALRDADDRWPDALRQERWADAHASLEEVRQRIALGDRLAELAMENSAAATPAHSSTIGGI